MNTSRAGGCEYIEGGGSEYIEGGGSEYIEGGVSEYIASVPSLKQSPRFMCMFSVSNARQHTQSI